MGFLSDIFGGGTPEAEVSEAETAEAELLAAMREGWNTTGLPAQREKIARTIGKSWNAETGTYQTDNNNQAMFDGAGNIKQQAVQGGNSMAGVSSAYESQRPTFNANKNGASSMMGDIEQAKAEAGATSQTAATGVQNALVGAGNMAGIAQGAQMQSLTDIGQLSHVQATEANASAANQFAGATNSRNTLAGLAGVGAAIYNNRTTKALPWTQADGTGVG